MFSGGLVQKYNIKYKKKIPCVKEEIWWFVKDKQFLIQEILYYIIMLYYIIILDHNIKIKLKCYTSIAKNKN